MLKSLLTQTTLKTPIYLQWRVTPPEKHDFVLFHLLQTVYYQGGNSQSFGLLINLKTFFFFFKRCPVELLNTSSTTIQQCFFTSGSPVCSYACSQHTFLPSVCPHCTDRQVAVNCREVQKCATRDCDCLLVNMDVNNEGLKTFKNLCFMKRETHKLWRK